MMKKYLLLALATSISALLAAPQLSFAAQSASVDSVPASRPLRVLIDPGHGGADAGGSDARLHEKDLNLRLALGLKAALEAQGMQVVLTRSEDQELKLGERLNVAHQSQADCLISLHLDAPQAEIPAYMLYYHGQGEGLAAMLDEHLRPLLPVSGRDVLQARGLYLVSKSPVPAVMVSGNWALMTRAPEQQALIQGLTRGLLAYAERRLQ